MNWIRLSFRGVTAVLLAIPLSVLANANTNILPYAESFEGYTNGYVITNCTGWSMPDVSEAYVRSNNTTWATSYTGPYPLPGATHTNVLYISGIVSNKIGGTEIGGVANTNQVWSDFLLMPGQVDETNSFSVGSDVQLAFYVKTNSHLVLLNGIPGPPSAVVPRWTELTGTTIASDQWVRFTVLCDYRPQDAINTNYYFQIFTNGTPLSDAAGYTANDGSCQSPGRWFCMANVSRQSMSNMVLQGTGWLDDLVITNNPIYNLTITASITNSPGTNGTITPSGGVSVPYSGGTNFTIQSNPGYHIRNVLVDNAPVGTFDQGSNTYVYTFANVMSNHTIAAASSWIPRLHTGP